VLAARAALGGDVPLVAEDLGLITPAVERLRDRLGLPGMRVLQFAFDGGAQNPHLPQNHPERSVAYTGTHDNDTTRGWWEQAEEWLRERVREVMRERGAWDDDPVWGMVRLTLGSPARCAIVPMQDLLGLGSGARMNTPGVRDGNWAWRVREEDLTDALAERLRGITAWGGRLA
jgi:4-alpha-glucanotransferase